MWFKCNWFSSTLLPVCTITRPRKPKQQKVAREPEKKAKDWIGIGIGISWPKSPQDKDTANSMARMRRRRWSYERGAQVDERCWKYLIGRLGLCNANSCSRSKSRASRGGSPFRLVVETFAISLPNAVRS